MTDKSRKEEEARAALKRLEAQSEKLLGTSSSDQAEEDHIERLGKRLGRILSYVLAAGLLYYLWTLL